MSGPTPEELQKAIERFADHLVELAAKLKSGEVIFANMRHTKTIERWWYTESPGDKDQKLMFFELQDMSISYDYHYPKHRVEELERKKAFLEAHPEAELMVLGTLDRSRQSF